MAAIPFGLGAGEVSTLLFSGGARAYLRVHKLLFCECEYGENLDIIIVFAKFVG
jgi:hypothetical protein